MTWSSSEVFRRLLSLWLLLPWLLLPCLVACADVIGIEERRADVAGSYPEQGYAGCRPGNCNGCLDVHRGECEARAACGQALEDGGCAGCVCESCTEQVVDCQLDSGCSAIWLCLRDTRCDPSERAAGSCLDACGTVIQANGGLTGSAWRGAIAIRSCAASAACLTCLAPQVQQSELSCSQQNGCQDCDDCFAQCLCSGERFGACRELCGDQAPTDCSEANGCANCGNCFDACACSGDTFEQCSQVCGAPTGTDPECTQATSCTGCTGCAAQCVCSGGGDAAACSTLCSPPAPEDACEFDPEGGTALCEGCNSCLARCTCNGRELSACMAECGLHECCSRGTSCGSGSVTACSCDSPAATCFEGVYGNCENFFDCDACACQQCPGELGVCLDLPGCKSIFDCMRNTECHGSACAERCGSGTTPQDFAVAEALWACYHGAQCDCSGVPPIISCPSAQGYVECLGYQSNTATLSACCPEATISNEQAETAGTPDSNPCGLELSRYFPSARACEPRKQANPPRFALLESCPDLPVGGVVYNGATLRGCCRAADGMCGYYDDVTGLECLNAAIFGMTPKPCG